MSLPINILTSIRDQVPSDAPIVGGRGSSPDAVRPQFERVLQKKAGLTVGQEEEGGLVAPLADDRLAAVDFEVNDAELRPETDASENETLEADPLSQTLALVELLATGKLELPKRQDVAAPETPVAIAAVIPPPVSDGTDTPLAATALARGDTAIGPVATPYIAASAGTLPAGAQSGVMPTTSIANAAPAASAISVTIADNPLPSSDTLSEVAKDANGSGHSGARLTQMMAAAGSQVDKVAQSFGLEGQAGQDVQATQSAAVGHTPPSTPPGSSATSPAPMEIATVRDLANFLERVRAGRETIESTSTELSLKHQELGNLVMRVEYRGERDVNVELAGSDNASHRALRAALQELGMETGQQSPDEAPGRSVKGQSSDQHQRDRESPLTSDGRQTSELQTDEHDYAGPTESDDLRHGILA